MISETNWNVGDRFAGEPKTVTQDNMDRFELVAGMAAGGTEAAAGPVNIHTDAEKAESMGLTRPVASGQMGFCFLHEMLAREFGADFRQGGELGVTFLKPVYGGDTVTAHAQVTAREGNQERVTLDLEVWVENEQGDKVSAGTARVTIPSPLT